MWVWRGHQFQILLQDFLFLVDCSLIEIESVVIENWLFDFKWFWN